MVYDNLRMRKAQIAKKLAKQSNITEGAAADQLDQMVNHILARLRKGQAASLPGLGTFRLDEHGLTFDQKRELTGGRH